MGVTHLQSYGAYMEGEVKCGWRGEHTWGLGKWSFTLNIDVYVNMCVYGGAPSHSTLKFVLLFKRQPTKMCLMFCV